MRLRIGTLLLLLPLLWTVSLPQRSESQTVDPGEATTAVSLDKAIEVALAQNSELQAISREIEAAQARVRVARSLGPPRLTLEASDISGAHLDRAATTKLGLEQEFPFPGKRGLRGEVAELEVSALRANQARIQRRLTAQVKEAYYLTRFQQEKVRNLQASDGLLNDFLQTTQKHFETGSAPYLDVVRAKVELTRLRNDLLDGQREVAKAKSGLNLLMGRTGSAPIELSTPLAVSEEEPDQEEALARAERESARLEEARLRLSSARTSRKLAGKERLPDPSLQLSVSKLVEGNETTGRWGAELGLAIPFPWWKAPGGLIDEADALIRRDEVNLAAAEREVRTAAEQALQDVATTRAQVRQFESSILDDLESELRSGIDAYRTGQVDALNLLDIYRTYIESRTEYSRSLYLFLSALAQLEAAGDVEP